MQPVTDQSKAVEIERIGKLDRVLGDRRHFPGTKRMLVLEPRFSKSAERWDDRAVAGLMQRRQELVPSPPVVRRAMQEHHGQAAVGPSM